MSETTIGKYVLAEYRGENSRMYIQSRNNIETKRGWWNTFTLADKKYAKNLQYGMYICKIIKFISDKNNNDICIVEPKKFLSDTDFETRDAVIYLFGEYTSDKFAIELPFIYYTPPRINFTAIFDKYGYGVGKINNLFDDFVNGKIDINELAICILKKSDYEQTLTDIVHNTESMRSKYPLLCDKVSKMFKDETVFFNNEREQKLDEYLSNLRSSYEKLLNNGVAIKSAYTMFNQAEAVIEYYKILDKQKKEAKKAERKAKRKEK